MKLKPEKDSGSNGIRNHDLCDTGAALFQLNYQVSKLGSGHLWVRNQPVDGGDTSEYIWYFWTVCFNFTVA